MINKLNTPFYFALTLHLNYRYHALIKREWLNRFKITNYEHAYRLVFEYIEGFYNTIRVHSHCDFKSPNEYEYNYLISNN